MGSGGSLRPLASPRAIGANAAVALTGTSVALYNAHHAREGNIKMSDREKAMTLWFQQFQHRFHRAGDGNETGDPVKVYNVYGHNPCGSDAIMMGGLWHRVGIKGAPARLVGHSISQAYFVTSCA